MYGYCIFYAHATIINYTTTTYISQTPNAKTYCPLRLIMSIYFRDISHYIIPHSLACETLNSSNNNNSEVSKLKIGNTELYHNPFSNKIILVINTHDVWGAYHVNFLRSYLVPSWSSVNENIQKEVQQRLKFKIYNVLQLWWQSSMGLVINYCTRYRNICMLLTMLTELAIAG